MGLKGSFKVFPIYLAGKGFSVLKGALVEFSIVPEREELERILREATRKYPRMHADKTARRFDKSWTGEVGEACARAVVVNLLGARVLPRRDPVPNGGYDGGDLRVETPEGALKILNVSSRKLSKMDAAERVFAAPQNYYVLIPKDQYDQYARRSDGLLPVFIRFEEVVSFEVEGIRVEAGLRGVAALPGFLTATDFKTMVGKDWARLKEKGEKLKGIYDDLRFGIPMYTDNYALPVGLLRNLEDLGGFLETGETDGVE